MIIIRSADARDPKWLDACADAAELPGVKEKGSDKLLVPRNAWPLVHAMLGERGWNVVNWNLPLKVLRRSLSEIEEIRWDPQARGQRIVAPFGLLAGTTGATETLTLLRWQREDPLKFADHRGVLFQWPGGSGKSLGALLWGLLAGGTIGIVCTAKARRQWARQIQRFTTASLCILRGEDQNDLIFEAGKIDPAPRILLTTWESLTYHYDKLIKTGIHSLILDESHNAKNRKRFRMVERSEDEAGRLIALARGNRRKANVKLLPDGRWVEFMDLENLFSATAKLSKAAARVAITTATPIKNYLRDYWAQLDYLEPYEWGSYWEWARRYCAAAPTGFNGSMEDKGRSHLDELKPRIKFLRSFVTQEEADKDLPKQRREAVLIPIDAQSRSDVVKSEISAAAKYGHDAMIEVMLADACARKRKWMIEEVREALCGRRMDDGKAAGTTKMVVFTSRRKDCEVLAEAFRKILPEGVGFWWGHGGFGELERDAMIAGIWTTDGQLVRHGFMTHPGPALFVGTREAFGESIDLHDADLVLMGMLPYTLGDLIQNERRFTRQGSRRPVLIKYPVAEGTYDERVAALLIHKLPAMVEISDEEGLVPLKRQLLGLGTDEEIRQGLIAAVLSGLKKPATPIEENPW